MKVGPKVPGPVVPSETGPASKVDGPGHPEKAAETRFRDAALPPEAAGPGEAAGLPTRAVTEAANRMAAGEWTAADAARSVAGAAVDAWPAGMADAATRSRVIEEMAEALAEDPVFHSLLRAAADGAR